MQMTILSMRLSHRSLLSKNSWKQKRNEVNRSPETNAKMPFSITSTLFSHAIMKAEISFHVDAIPNRTLCCPYNGEEVYLHWANRDQYYVKSGEHFSTYRFKSQDTTVTFDLRDVDIEKDNVQGQKRFLFPYLPRQPINRKLPKSIFPLNTDLLLIEKRKSTAVKNNRTKLLILPKRKS